MMENRLWKAIRRIAHPLPVITHEGEAKCVLLASVQ
jgi:hypothetical protein